MGITSADLSSTLDAVGLDLGQARSTPEVQSTAKSLLSTQRDNNLADRKARSTAFGSTQRVSSLSKIASKELSAGGASIISGEVNPTDFVPGTDFSGEEKLPDYYRNGRIVEAPNPDGPGTISAYSPIPRTVGERDNPVLASIRLIDPKRVNKSGTPGTNTSRQGSLVPEYSKFFLESVQESHQEKYQIVETFNDWYVYFYGERPPVYNFSGHLLNFANYNWKNEFMYFYQNFWRGTKAAELGARVFLTYDYQQIQGYILGVSTNTNALTDKAAPFNIQVLVTKRLIFNGPKQGDNIVRDNLLPRSESGLINTEANSFAQAITNQYLKDGEAAASQALIGANNQDLSVRTLSNSSASAPAVPLPNAGGINFESAKKKAVQRASFIINPAKKLFNF